jgi:FKBP-type peptidyl-prolyl cis-trans isomerase
MKVLNQVFHGSNDDATGATTLRLGVKYVDVVEGKGPEAQNRNLVTVEYRLTAGKFGATIDSGSNFNFRLGKGEVIQGWDIGVVGMRVGGRRQLIVPPKAGYGGQDIGAGPGATIFFDITLLACR